MFQPSMLLAIIYLSFAISRIEINKDEEIFSLDVVSLYTNVDLLKSLRVVEENWDVIEEGCQMEYKTFHELVIFIVWTSVITSVMTIKLTR